MAKLKSRVIRLSHDTVDLVSRGGNKALPKQLHEQLDDAEAKGQVIYACYSESSLQCVRVSALELAINPLLAPRLENPKNWKVRP